MLFGCVTLFVSGVGLGLAGDFGDLCWAVGLICCCFSLCWVLFSLCRFTLFCFYCLCCLLQWLGLLFVVWVLFALWWVLNCLFVLLWWVLLACWFIVVIVLGFNELFGGLHMVGCFSGRGCFLVFWLVLLWVLVFG